MIVLLLKVLTAVLQAVVKVLQVALFGPDKPEPKTPWNRKGHFVKGGDGEWIKIIYIHNDEATPPSS
jgi:hypothetical protein